MITIGYSDRLGDMSIEDKEALSQSATHWGRRERLTRDEAVALAQAKDAGIAAAAQLAVPGCTDIGTLTKIKDGGIAARNTLVECNMQLVIRIARSWCGRGVPLEDLIQEGTIGLMRAADLFDWQRGNEFSTFAGLRIVAACQRAIENQGDVIRIPVHTRSSGRCGPEVERAKRVVSGNKPIGSRGGNTGLHAVVPTLFDIVKGPANTEDEALLPLFADQTAGEIATALMVLNPQEQAVIEARYLSGSHEPVTFQAVGDRLGITKQRVEQVQKTAFVKLRSALQGVERDN